LIVNQILVDCECSSS